MCTDDRPSILQSVAVECFDKIFLHQSELAQKIGQESRLQLTVEGVYITRVGLSDFFSCLGYLRNRITIQKTFPVPVRNDNMLLL